MVAANHMDYYDTTIVESMYMTNIMPQTSSLNKHAWLHAEEIFECYRDLENLMTIVGIIMGNTGGGDLFMKSHGVRTPAFYWRIIQKESGDVIAWIMV
jgi:endonuclease G